MTFGGKRTELEILVLSELSQAQKAHVLAYLWNLDLNCQ
jgi:hypothetical protein